MEACLPVLYAIIQLFRQLKTLKCNSRGAGRHSVCLLETSKSPSKLFKTLFNMVVINSRRGKKSTVQLIS